MAAGLAVSKSNAFASRAVVEGETYGEGVRDSLRGDAGGQHGSHVVGIDAVLAGQLAEHAQRRTERFFDRRVSKSARVAVTFSASRYHWLDVAECAAAQNGASSA
jgi:hypothetical protein